MIKIEGLNFKYPDGIEALRDVSVEILKGESVGLIGPNGAGKTTLLLHLNGILKGDGKVWIDGMEVKDKNLPSIRRKVGFVFQDPDDQLFTPTVYEDVAFAPLNMGYSRREVDNRVESALSSVGMQGFEKRESFHLSFGEKKRISLATVLAQDPSVLVFDEPTSNLDPKSRRDFINLLKGLAATRVIATHDLDLVVESCAKIVLLDKGRICAVGSAEDILSNGELLQAHSLEIPLSLKAYRKKPAAPSPSYQALDA